MTKSFCDHCGEEITGVIYYARVWGEMEKDARGITAMLCWQCQRRVRRVILNLCPSVSRIDGADCQLTKGHDGDHAHDSHGRTVGWV